MITQSTMPRIPKSSYTQPQAGRYIVPSIEERSNRGVSVTDPYSKSFENRVLYLAAPVDSVSAVDVTSQLLYLNDKNPDSEITLYIHSPGGSISETRMITDTIHHISAPVQTICLGKAFGAAALVLAAGDKRFALPSARMMIMQEQASGAGTVTNMEVEVAEHEENLRWVKEFLARRSNKEIEQIHEDINRPKFMSAQESVDYGLIDKIIDKED